MIFKKRRKGKQGKKLLFIFALIIICVIVFSCQKKSDSFNGLFSENVSESGNPLVISARKQIGTVTSYDSSYYIGGYPPEDTGACTDVIERALRDNGYDLKSKIDNDMKVHPERYEQESDPNINYRRVKNVKTFLDYHATSLVTCENAECIKKTDWQPGDIVTFDQIPGSLWHIAIVSDKKNEGVPLLIHNYGKGVVEDDKLLKWPAPMTGRYRISL